MTDDANDEKGPTLEEILEKCDELTDMIDEFTGWQQNVASLCIFNIVAAVANDPFEGIGILHETLLRYREVSNDVMNEDESTAHEVTTGDDDDDDDTGNKFDVN